VIVGLDGALISPSKDASHRGKFEGLSSISVLKVLALFQDPDRLPVKITPVGIPF